jgi:exonuclease VII large subunit
MFKTHSPTPAAAPADVSRYCTECEQAGKRIAGLERLVQSTADELHRKNNRILSLESGLAVKQLESALAAAERQVVELQIGIGESRKMLAAAKDRAEADAAGLREAVQESLATFKRMRHGDGELAVMAQSGYPESLCEAAVASHTGQPLLDELAKLRNRVAELEAK